MYKNKIYKPSGEQGKGAFQMIRAEAPAKHGYTCWISLFIKRIISKL